MYFVEIVSKDETLDMDGCIQFRISDSGIVSADFVDGSARIYRMREGDEVIRAPMSEEDIHAHPELGPWYREQIVKAEVAKEEAAKAEAKAAAQAAAQAAAKVAAETPIV